MQYRLSKRAFLTQMKGFIDEIGWVSGEFTKRDHVLHVVDRGGNTMKWKKNH